MLYRKTVPTTISTGASEGDNEFPAFLSKFIKVILADEGEQMPGEIADTVDVGGHEGHDLRLRREVIFLRSIEVPSRFRFSLLAIIVSCRTIGSSRCEILSDQGLGK